MRSLHISHNSIYDFNFLKKFKNLEIANFRGNCLSDEDKLENIKFFLNSNEISFSSDGQRINNSLLNNLLRTLYSNRNANRRFNEFRKNSYKRFVDFIETQAATEATKSEFYDRWNFALLHNRDLQEAGFPEN